MSHHFSIEWQRHLFRSWPVVCQVAAYVMSHLNDCWKEKDFRFSDMRYWRSDIKEILVLLIVSIDIHQQSDKSWKICENTMWSQISVYMGCSVLSCQSYQEGIDRWYRSSKPSIVPTLAACRVQVGLESINSSSELSFCTVVGTRICLDGWSDLLLHFLAGWKWGFLCHVIFFLIHFIRNFLSCLTFALKYSNLIFLLALFFFLNLWCLFLILWE
jgi:hypothetical protein